ncbi:LuxR C-terminal-related transcriptional regulator [Streptomyces acidiscabies]|uniref:LuxR C-terminal-related transcriptional regulator n=1 Tax=Streptomyces acidiscabies TaxID=42234 RepID=UPI001C4D7652|nr:LuxR C-terminal-related transcriptional regulator [Streptomyces acidiscabies]
MQKTLASAASGAGASLLIEGGIGAGKSYLMRAAVRTARAHGFEAIPVRARSSGTSLLHEDRFERFADSLGGRRPLLLAVDDLHGADGPALEWLDRLTARLEGLPVALFATLTPGLAKDGTGTLARVVSDFHQRTVLSGLDPDAVGYLLTSAFGRPVTESVVHACHRVTGGNPLLVHALLRELRRAGTDREPTVEQIAALGSVDVAETVVARFEERSPGIGRALDAIAVTGRTATPNLVAALVGIPCAEAADVLHILARCGVLHGNSEGGVFAQPLVRTSLLAALPPSEQVRLHAAAARALHSLGAPAHEVVHHLRRAPRIGEQWAHTLLFDSTRAALARHDVVEARALQKRCALEDGPGDPSELLRRLGRAELVADSPAVAVGRLHALASTPADDDSAVVTLVDLALATTLTGDIAGAQRTMLTGLNGWGPLDPSREAVAGAYAVLGVLTLLGGAGGAGVFGGLSEASGVMGAGGAGGPGGLSGAGELSEAGAFGGLGGSSGTTGAMGLGGSGGAVASGRPGEPGGTVVSGRPGEPGEPLRPGVPGAVDRPVPAFLPALTAARTPWVRLAQATFAALAALQYGGQREEAVRHARAGLGEPFGPADLPTLPLRLLLTQVLCGAGEHDEALAVCRTLAATAREESAHTMAALAEAALAACCHRAGRLREAVRAARSALTDGPPGAWIGSALARCRLGGILVHTGDLAGARRLLLDDQGLAGLPETALPSLLLHRGELHAALGHPQAALADLEECGRALQGAHQHEHFPWRGAAAILHARAGDATAAERLAREELEAARTWGAPHSVAAALRTLAQVTRSGQPLALLYEAAELLEGSGARLELARVLRGLGHELRRLHKVRDAREQLRAALALAEECGDRSLVDALREDLASAGARLRRGTETGLDALTPAEYRTALLAAEGLTNREIADRSYVTRRTVELHLSRVYRKLSVSGRSDLPGVFGASPRLLALRAAS